MTSTAVPPRIILGTMPFGLETTNLATCAVRVQGVEKVRPFLEAFRAAGHTEVDTARIYGNGDTESVLAQLDLSGFKVATKVFPGKDLAHNAENLPKTFHESLKALGGHPVDILYLHSPDYSVPFEETAKAMNDLYKQGLFKEFGISNFTTGQTERMHKICRDNNYVLPTVYQGLLNPLDQDGYKLLAPIFKRLNIRFYAYNPVAGGLLTGKFSYEAEVEKGSRFDASTAFGEIFRSRLWFKEIFEAIDIIKLSTDRHQIPLLEATMRWMCYHSGLSSNDGLILGASTVAHLEENMESVNRGPLPQDVVDAFAKGWNHVKDLKQSHMDDDEFRKNAVNASRRKLIPDSEDK